MSTKRAPPGWRNWCVRSMISWRVSLASRTHYAPSPAGDPFLPGVHSMLQGLSPQMANQLPVLTGLGGILVGALVVELHRMFQSLRERTRALRTVLYNLLDLRYEL